MKSIAKKLCDFCNRNELSIEFIQKMAKEYALSDEEKSCSFFTEKYGISKSCFYRAKDFAIICCLVNPKTAQLIMRKSAFNSRRHGSSTGSFLHSEDLLEQQKDFIDSFSQSDMEDICHKYAEGLELWVIANQYQTGSYGIQLLLKKAILSGIASSDTMMLIEQRLQRKGRSLKEIYPK